MSLTSNPNPQPESRSYRIPVDGVGEVDLSTTECGAGGVFLFLHGGGGPQSFVPFATSFAAAHPVRTITPTHPGFAGTTRPRALATIADLARLYVGLLDELDLSGVTLVGNSIGGWIAAEMATLHTPRIQRLVLLDAVGIEVPGHPVADFFSLTVDEMSQLTFHDPDKFKIDPAKLPPAAREALPGNRASLATYTNTTDQTLAARLATVTVKTLVLWGAADRVADPEYGRNYAQLIPGARFQLLPNTGHLPQVETPAQVASALERFAINE